MAIQKTLIHQRVELARKGENPLVIGKTRSGWAVLGDSQFFTGYSLLLADPVVPSLNELSEEARKDFLYDMSAIGDALLSFLAPRGVIRINYEILGNLDPALHAHIFPRYDFEPEEMKKGPVYYYPKEERRSVPFDPLLHQELLVGLRTLLHTQGVIE